MSLSDLCEHCSRPFGFPLTFFPAKVNDYEIRKPIQRGFFGATYLAKHPRLGVPRVLKVIPKGVYAHHGKDFEDECLLHVKAQNGAEHLVRLIDKYSATIKFGDAPALDCHVAELEEVQDFLSLSDFLAEATFGKNGSEIVQVASDLFQILHELRGNLVRHNDLHEGNLLVSRSKLLRRSNAIDPNVKVWAVDLGSVSEESKSNLGRVGDLHSVCQHLLGLTRPIIVNPEKAEHRLYRTALEINRLAQSHLPVSVNQREVPPQECVSMIRRSWDSARAPWQAPLIMQTHADGSNAQSIHSWHVPELFVDPETWISEVSSAGPTIITGMRGCGKTMLLRSLDAQARLVQRDQQSEPDYAKDEFIGLYVSCTRLLVKPGAGEDIPAPFSRLIAAYALEAMLLIDRIRVERNQGVSANAEQDLLSHVFELLDIPKDQQSELLELLPQRALEKLLIELQSSSVNDPSRLHPVQALESLAKVIKRTVTDWSSRRVFYLLDDASTRYLQLRVIESLVSKILTYSGVEYSFKVTTEEQTFQGIIRSLGGLHTARSGRDYNHFDLGQRVLHRLREEGPSFVEEILKRRAAHKPGARPESPVALLGNCSLEDVARSVVRSKSNTKERQSVYHGISALVGLCVGDLGDIVTLYDKILSRAQNENIPIDSQMQSSEFINFGSERLFDLNRRKSFKAHALSFAEASHKLLLASARKLTSMSSPQGPTRKRLRQYSELHVSIDYGTPAEIEQQFDQILKLIDAGVFVFSGGPDAPRAKARGQDPVTQFKLAFRKVYGLTTFIGLGSSDRFELKGERLKDWLDDPTAEKLLKGEGGEQSGPLSDDEIITFEELLPTVSKSKSKSIEKFAPRVSKSTQYSMFSMPDAPKQDEILEKLVVGWHLPSFEVAFKETSLSESGVMDPEAICASIGFEERTVISLRRLVQRFPRAKVVLCEYDDKGRREELIAMLNSHGIHPEVFSACEMGERANCLPKSTVVDATTLAKPQLFAAVRNLYMTHGSCVVAYTAPEVSLPTESALESLGRDGADGTAQAFLSRLEEINRGESGRYQPESLLKSEQVYGRSHVLVGFASAKTERLMSFLDHAEFDAVVVGIDASEQSTRRLELTRKAGEVVANNFQGRIVEMERGGVSGVYDFLVQQFKSEFVNNNRDIEIVLSGTKLQAIAVALASVNLRLSEVWYVRPEKVDRESYSLGAGPTSVIVMERPVS